MFTGFLFKAVFFSECRTAHRSAAFCKTAVNESEFKTAAHAAVIFQVVGYNIKTEAECGAALFYAGMQYNCIFHAP